MRHTGETRDASRVRVGFPYKATMGVTLICPKCQGETELRGTMDAWYMTWCPACERIWRLELWTLIHEEDAEQKIAALGVRQPVKG